MLSDIPTQGAERRVRRLRLRLQNADGMPRASAALRDALHTASLPEAEGARWLLIKRLNLGCISVRASPPTLALRIAEAARAVADRAVRFDQAGADRADAVVFPERTDALVALARRLARRESTGEWFWDHVAPGWNQARTRVARWRLLLAAAHSLEGFVATAAAGAVLHQAAGAGAIDELLTAVQPREAARWLQCAGWADTVRGRALASGPLRVSPPITAMLVRLRAVLGGDDIRLVWAGTLLAVHDNPARAAFTDLPERIVDWLQRCPSPSLREDTVNHRPRPEDDTSNDEPAPHAESTELCNHKIDSGDQPETWRASGGSPLNGTAFSPCAGLLLIANVLERLRFDRVLARHPEMIDAAFPSRLLGFIGREAGMTRDDPMMLVLDPEIRDGGEASANEIPDRSFRPWLTAVQRWCDRRARLDWRQVICRPGRVRCTRTQIDVSFAADQADVALRRIALDVDPGWLPWLGRVIRFHYLDAHEQTH